MRRLLPLMLVTTCAGHVQAPVVAPVTVPTYTVPWDALDSSMVCADTLPTISWKPCMTVRRFRELVLDKQVSP